jgi:hypothetical protein
MSWRYKFDGGEEHSLPHETSLYDVAALAAFGREKLDNLPDLRLGVQPYAGHVLELWARDVGDKYLYGIGFNQCGSLQLIGLRGTPPVAEQSGASALDTSVRCGAGGGIKAPANVRKAAYALCQVMRQTCRNYPGVSDLRTYVRDGYEMEYRLREALADAESALLKPDPI